MADNTIRLEFNETEALILIHFANTGSTALTAFVHEDANLITLTVEKLLLLCIKRHFGPTETVALLEKFKEQFNKCSSKPIETTILDQDMLEHLKKSGESKWQN